MLINYRLNISKLKEFRNSIIANLNEHLYTHVHMYTYLEQPNIYKNMYFDLSVRHKYFYTSPNFEDIFRFMCDNRCMMRMFSPCFCLFRSSVCLPISRTWTWVLTSQLGRSSRYHSRSTLECIKYGAMWVGDVLIPPFLGAKHPLQITLSVRLYVYMSVISVERFLVYWLIYIRNLWRRCPTNRSVRYTS